MGMKFWLPHPNMQQLRTFLIFSFVALRLVQQMPRETMRGPALVMFPWLFRFLFNSSDSSRNKPNPRTKGKKKLPRKRCSLTCLRFQAAS